MLSRVAAVKAPRTHNRRRVTGSSGRRREGRESEPQRPNMSRRVFTSAVLLLLVVMMFCGTGGAAQTDGTQSTQGSSPKPYFDWRDTKGDEKVGSLRFPSLVEVDGGVFAVAEAQCTKSDCDFTGIASQLLGLSDGTLTEELSGGKLKTEVLVNSSSGEAQCPSQTAERDASIPVMKVHLGRPTTVVKGSDIYMLAGNYSRTDATDADFKAYDAVRGGLLLVRGNVSGATENNKRIYWNDTYGLPWFIFDEHESLTRLIGSGGSGVKMQDGTFVFPVEGTKKQGESGKDRNTVSLILYWRDNNKSWKLSKGMSADGCSDPSVVEWKDKLMMMTACDDGRRRVYEIGDKGESWTEALGTFSRVWGDKRKRHERGVGSGFITATGVDSKRNVMLVTLPVYSKRKEEGNGNEKGELHLWLTDNTHIVDIGPVSGNDDDDEDAAASSLFYKSAESETNGKEELIALYEKKKGSAGKPSPGMASVLLTAQLKRVKEVLATWNEVDDRVSHLCPPSSAAQGTSTGNACSAGQITAGLVGFLSGNFSGNAWKDEYLGVNATVKGGAEMTDNGVKLQGVWAEWPVGKQGQNQLYHFANYNFTLVATVSIAGEPTKEDSIPLMGVKMNDNDKTVLLGLSYNKKRRWELLCSGGTTKEHSSSWDPETTYQVAIVLQNSSQGSVYVDGQRVGGSPFDLKDTDSKQISHFFIGGDGKNAGKQEDVPVTVTNVLLYNRPLNENEIGVLNANKISIPKTVAARTSSPAGSSPKGSAENLAAGARGEGTARHVGAHGDGSTVCGSGLLPLLLLVGLWGVAAL
ncbi:trans-sialidase, putative [Trypanosoma cruzi marinkellei]|uniref:Trans-sialidase, putative n=1 Tax=Trypanosoma cruzi marinkellei TaxID=85056 RepID=K2LZT3_TRYCR|nr:trans-sialidase, putative [Trypanosoma cruzi marinkellei]